MKRTKNLATIGFLLYSAFSFAQWRSVDMVDDHTVHRIDDGTNITYAILNRLPDKETILGSEYIDVTFQNATVNNGDRTFKLRYNNNTGYFEYEDEKKEVISISKDQNKVISYKNGETYFLKKVPNSKDEQGEYLKVIGNINDEVKIYSLEKIKFVEGKTGKNSYEKSQQSEFRKMKPQYYVEYNNKLETFNTINDLIKIFPNKKEELKKYSKTNSSKFENIADIKKIQQYLVTLL